MNGTCEPQETDMPKKTISPDFGEELIASMKEALAIAKDEMAPARVHLARDMLDVKAIRTKLGLTREAFASRFGLKVGAIRDWEQGLRRPDPAARTLLRVIEREPEAVQRALETA